MVEVRVSRRPLVVWDSIVVPAHVFAMWIESNVIVEWKRYRIRNPNIATSALPVLKPLSKLALLNIL